MVVDYYNTLKVSRSATDEDLKRAYKRLAMKWHPDKNAAAEAEARFKQISEAYDVLSDPERRRIYDLYGDEALRSGQFRPPTARDADDIFAEFFITCQNQFLASDDLDLPLAGEARLLVPHAAKLVSRPVAVLLAEVVPAQPHQLVYHGRRRVVPRHRRRVGLRALLLLRLPRLHRLTINYPRRNMTRMDGGGGIRWFFQIWHVIEEFLRRRKNVEWSIRWRRRVCAQNF